DEAGRWAAQAQFWEAIAERCANRPGVFCYDLLNEPMVPGEKQKPGAWIVPVGLGGFYYVQDIALDPAGRDRSAISVAWTQRIAAAIRARDHRHLITIGLLPNSVPGPGFTSGFIPRDVAPYLDFICLHLYPEHAKL